MKWILILLTLCSCTASFQPWPGVTKTELGQTNENIMSVAQAVQKLSQDVEALKTKMTDNKVTTSGKEK